MKGIAVCADVCTCLFFWIKVVAVVGCRFVLAAEHTERYHQEICLHIIYSLDSYFSNMILVVVCCVIYAIFLGSSVSL